MRKLMVPVAVLIGSLMTAVPFGCGGGGAASGQGSVGLAVAFPPRAETASPAGTGMPAVTESVKITVVIFDPGATPVIEGQVVINRPANQAVVRRNIDGIPAGEVLVEAICFDGRNATGDAVAQARSVETVTANQVTSVTLVTDRFAERVGIYEVPMPGGDPQPLAAITLEPREDVSVQARGRDYDGAEAVYVEFGWTVSPPSEGLTLDPTTGSIVSVNAHEDGEYTATVTDAMSGQSYALEVAVVSRAPAEVDLNPRQATLWRFGSPEQMQLSATVRDADGEEIRYAELAWGSGDPSVAIVGADGLVTAEGPGSATITASGITATGVAEATCEIEVIDQGHLDVIVQ
ncbi:MAG: Ig-like domain-containing protein [Armatimonadota bacterium]